MKLSQRTCTVAVLMALLGGAGCRSYDPVPLELATIVQDERTRRGEFAGTTAVTLADAVERLAEHQPELRRLRAQTDVAEALASVSTPWSNPTLELIPKASSFSKLLAGRWMGEVAIGWTLPIFGVESVTDDLNEAKAQAARIEFASAARLSYLELRGEFAAVALTKQRRDVALDVEETTRNAVALVRRLVEAARATALDVRGFELEAYEAESDRHAAEEAHDDARADLALRLGLSLDTVRVEGELPSLDRAVPGIDELRELFVNGHPELDHLRAEYDVAEAELRLAIRRQFPSIELVVSDEREGGDKVIGLGPSVDIPLFDRNQPEIAEAEAKRDAARTAFTVRIAEGLGALERSRRRLVHRTQRLELIRTRLAPAAAKALALARRTLESGATDALQILTVVRNERRARVALIEAQLGAFAAWTALELACGAPLLTFPDSPKEGSR